MWSIVWQNRQGTQGATLDLESILSAIICPLLQFNQILVASLGVSFPKTKPMGIRDCNAMGGNLDWLDALLRPSIYWQLVGSFSIWFYDKVKSIKRVSEFDLPGLQDIWLRDWRGRCRSRLDGSGNRFEFERAGFMDNKFLIREFIFDWLMGGGGRGESSFRGELVRSQLSRRGRVNHWCYCC